MNNNSITNRNNPLVNHIILSREKAGHSSLMLRESISLMDPLPTLKTVPQAVSLLIRFQQVKLPGNKEMVAARNGDLQVRLFQSSRGLRISLGALCYHLKYMKYWKSCNRMEKEWLSSMEEIHKFHK